MAFGWVEAIHKEEVGLKSKDSPESPGSLLFFIRAPPHPHPHESTYPDVLTVCYCRSRKMHSHGLRHVTGEERATSLYCCGLVLGRSCVLAMVAQCPGACTSQFHLASHNDPMPNCPLPQASTHSAAVLAAVASMWTAFISSSQLSLDTWVQLLRNYLKLDVVDECLLRWVLAAYY